MVSGLAAEVSRAEDIGEARVKPVADSMVGKAAPGVELKLLTGDVVSTGALVGRKPLYFKFWATWCIPCREQMQHLQSVHEKYGDQLQVVALNAGINDSRESVETFLRREKVSAPIAIDADGSVARAFNLTVTPQHIVIDRSGTIRYVGHLASDELDKVLAAVVDSGAASTAEEGRSVAPTAEAGAPGIALLDGTKLDSEYASEKPTILFFFATWGDWYLEETRPEISKRSIAFQESIAALYAQSKEKYSWLGVAHSLWTTEDDLREYRDRVDASYPLALDMGGALYSKYAVRDFPTVVILDKEGKVSRVITKDVRAIETALAGR